MSFPTFTQLFTILAAISMPFNSIHEDPGKIVESMDAGCQTLEDLLSTMTPAVRRCPCTRGDGRIAGNLSEGLGPLGVVS